MGHQNGIKRIRHKEVCVLRIGLIHVYYSMYFYYLLLFVIHVLSLHKLEDLLLYFSLYVMCYLSAELLYVYQTVGVCIRKWLADQTTTDDTASYLGFAKIDSSKEI